MQQIGSKAFVISEYYFAISLSENVPPFSYLNNNLPELKYSDTPVPVVFAESGALYFQEPEGVKKHRFIYTKVFSDQKQEVLFSTISHSRYKIWLNGLYVGVCTGFDLFTFYLTLEEGENCIVLEMDLSNPNYYDINNRVSLHEMEKNNSQSFLCGTCLEYHKWIQFFQNTDCRKENQECTCIYIPRCYRFVKSGRIKVLDDFDNILDSSDALPGKLISFCTESLKLKSPRTIRMHLLLEIEFIDGTTTTRQQSVWVRSYQEEKEKLIARSEEALLKTDSYTRNFIINEYNRYLRGSAPETFGEAVALYKLDKLLKRIENEELPYYLNERNSLIYYYSQLDCQFRKIRICKPPVLTTDHPGLVVFINIAGNSTGMKVAHLLKEHTDLIVVDIAIAGFSTGTPISEALIKEGLEEVEKIYKFDKQRVYWYGYCNSGYAVWSYCQNHPDIATNILSVESVPDRSRIDNIRHCKTLLYYWNNEDYQKIDFLNREKNHSVVRIKDSTHNYMQFYQFRSENFLNLNDRLLQYPDEIHFSTERLRHNKSFWITLNSIRKGKKRANVWGQVVDPQKLKIRIIHCDDFTIETSPKLMDCFSVEINGVLISNISKQPSMRFVRNQKGRFELSQNVVTSVSRKGTGLIDVYYGPMRIVCDHNDIAYEIARNFAEPETMTFSPKLNVKFPIFLKSEFPVNERSKNLVLINVDELDGVRIEFPIKTKETGFSYGRTSYEGSYCILQVIPNPFNSSSSILQIKSNNLEIFRKQLWLRKVILPSMLTGISNRWNSEAIILTEDSTRVVYEMEEL